MSLLRCSKNRAPLPSQMVSASSSGVCKFRRTAPPSRGRSTPRMRFRRGPPEPDSKGGCKGYAGAIHGGGGVQPNDERQCGRRSTGGFIGATGRVPERPEGCAIGAAGPAGLARRATAQDRNAGGDECHFLSAARQLSVALPAARGVSATLDGQQHLSQIPAARGTGGDLGRAAHGAT